eukprot:gene26757-biopygen17300
MTAWLALVVRTAAECCPIAYSKHQDIARVLHVGRQDSG